MPIRRHPISRGLSLDRPGHHCTAADGRAVPERPRLARATVAVLSALASALATFLVLAGATPILPTHNVVVWVFLLNGAADRSCCSGSSPGRPGSWCASAGQGRRRPVSMCRIVGLFSLVAVLPAILVAAVATVTLERGLDPWFTGSIKELMNNTVSIARSYRETAMPDAGPRNAADGGRPQPRQGSLRRRSQRSSGNS